VVAPAPVVGHLVGAAAHDHAVLVLVEGVVVERGDRVRPQLVGQVPDEQVVAVPPHVGEFLHRVLPAGDGMVRARSQGVDAGKGEEDVAVGVGPFLDVVGPSRMVSLLRPIGHIKHRHVIVVHALPTGAIHDQFNIGIGISFRHITQQSRFREVNIADVRVRVRGGSQERRQTGLRKIKQLGGGAALHLHDLPAGPQLRRTGVRQLVPQRVLHRQAPHAVHVPAGQVVQLRERGAVQDHLERVAGGRRRARVGRQHAAVLVQEGAGGVRARRPAAGGELDALAPVRQRRAGEVVGDD